MFNIADIIILVIILISAFVGYKRGFIKTLFKLISFFVAIILAFMLCKPVAGYLTENTQIDEWIITQIEGKYIEEKENNTEQTDTENIETTIQNLPSSIQKMLGIEEFKDQAVRTVSQRIAEIAINIISIIVVFIVIKIILMIVAGILDGIMQIPVLKQINEILGIVIGVVLGLLQIYIIFMIVTFFASFIDIDVFVTYIKNSIIARMLYENNILIALLF